MPLRPEVHNNYVSAPALTRLPWLLRSHERAHTAAEVLKRDICREYGVPLFPDTAPAPPLPGGRGERPAPINVRRAAVALMHHRDQMPAERRRCGPWNQAFVARPFANLCLCSDASRSGVWGANATLLGESTKQCPHVIGFTPCVFPSDVGA